MGCGCGGGRRSTGSRRSAALTPRSVTQARPAQAQAVQGLSQPTNNRQEIERKRRIQISLRKKNGSA